MILILQVRKWMLIVCQTHRAISGSFPVSSRRWEVRDKYLVSKSKVRFFGEHMSLDDHIPCSSEYPHLLVSHTKFNLFRHYLKHDGSQVSHSGKRKGVSLCESSQ